GVKHHWQAGDVLNLPLRGNGIIVQHFNTDPDKMARFVAAEPNWFECATVDRGSGFEQLEDAPEYRVQEERLWPTSSRPGNASARRCKTTPMSATCACATRRSSATAPVRSWCVRPTGR